MNEIEWTIDPEVLEELEEKLKPIVADFQKIQRKRKNRTEQKTENEGDKGIDIQCLYPFLCVREA